MLELKTFLKNFNAEDLLEMSNVVQLKEFYFTLNRQQRTILATKPVFIGYCLGKKKGNSFCPSVSLLDYISLRNVKKIIVDEKTEWLFICGRDIFNIQQALGSPQEKDNVLVLNRFKECIGIAQYTATPSKRNPVRHIYDIGDYLRRERKRKL